MARDRDQLDTALARFARYYMSNDDHEGLASDLLLILQEFIPDDLDAISSRLAWRLDDELADIEAIDAEDEADA
jgi:hypothetical protein|tara:strand:- start:343 stop:564 length:222 start_codon:yes stop_codon:yes gene_type:complete